VAAYLQALNAPFISDDIIYITSNTRLAGLRLTELWHLLAEPYNGASEFLPLRELSYWFDITLFGQNPVAFRLHNIFLYLLCLPFVYGITLDLWQYFRPADAASAPWASAVVTALFALHPAHAEAVVWIAGRKDVLSGMFSLLALWLAIRARRTQGLAAPYATATLVALLAAMYSKATAVAVAAIIAMLWVIFWRDAPAGNRQRSTLLWPLASILLATCVALSFAMLTTQKIPLYFGIETVTRALAVLGWLVRLAVSPESHHFFYPVFEDPWLPAMAALGGAALIAAGWGAMTLLRKPSLEGFAVVAFLLLCIPSIQLIPYKPPSLVSDRFLFLAVWAGMLLLVALSWRLNRVPRTALLLIIAMVWCFQTLERPRDWRSFETIIDNDLHAYPGYYMPAAYKIIGIQLPQGMYREASESANAITDPEFRELMVKLVNADTALTGKLQNAMALMNNLDLALKQPPAQAKWNPPFMVAWEKCQVRHVRQWMALVKQFPDDMLVRYNAGLWMSETGYYKDAVTHLRTATESQNLPESMRGTAFKNLGLALIGIGYIDNAEAPLRAALDQAQPDMRVHCLLVEVYKHSNRFKEMARAETECHKQPQRDWMTQ
jgi:tetratricopeptide (TPR) repeat protein